MLTNGGQHRSFQTSAQVRTMFQSRVPKSGPWRSRGAGRIKKPANLQRQFRLRQGGWITLLRTRGDAADGDLQRL
jgi:hypothetical protein